MCEENPVSVTSCEGKNCKLTVGENYDLDDLQEFSASNGADDDTVMVCPVCYNGLIS